MISFLPQQGRSGPQAPLAPSAKRMRRRPSSNIEHLTWTIHIWRVSAGAKNPIMQKKINFSLGLGAAEILTLSFSGSLLNQQSIFCRTNVWPLKRKKVVTKPTSIKAHPSFLNVCESSVWCLNMFSCMTNQKQAGQKTKNFCASISSIVLFCEKAGEKVFVSSFIYLFVYFFLIHSYASHPQCLPIKRHTLGYIWWVYCNLG